MPHALTELKLAEVTRPVGAGSEPGHEIHADVCVVGAGIAGLSAAIESARLHRDVVLVDSLPVIGGQMVHSLIGLFCGIFGNGPNYVQFTHGIFDDIFRDLDPSADLHFQRGHTMTIFTTRSRSAEMLHIAFLLARRPAASHVVDAQRAALPRLTSYAEQVQSLLQDAAEDDDYRHAVELAAAAPRD